MSVMTLIDRDSGKSVFEGNRVTRSRKCPVCDHDSWCLVDSPRCLAICPRVESARKIGDAGWLHSFGGVLPSEARLSRPTNEVLPLEGADAMQSKFVRQSSDRLAILAFELGVSVESLSRLGSGWNGMWTFPMRNHREEIVGFRTRTSDGRKLAIKGSRSGLFIPADRQRGRGACVWIVEGPSDVAAMMDMGLNAIGRPACRGCEEEVCRWTQGMEVIVVADADPAGIAGATSLTQRLRGSAMSVDMILPPWGMKDAREVQNHGGSSGEWLTVLTDSRRRRSTNGRQA